MLTADTITDEQIRDLRSDLHSEGHTDTLYVALCDVALGRGVCRNRIGGRQCTRPAEHPGDCTSVPYVEEMTGATRSAARARCAELLNKRRQETAR